MSFMPFRLNHQVAPHGNPGRSQGIAYSEKLSAIYRVTFYNQPAMKKILIIGVWGLTLLGAYLRGHVVGWNRGKMAGEAEERCGHLTD